MKPKQILFLADDLRELNKASDSSWALMFEASAMNHNVFYAHSAKLSMDSEVFVLAHYMPIEFFQHEENLNSSFISDLALPKERINLNDCDLIFMRKDPPMDADYILQTNLLSFVDNAFIVNSPYALREFNEKLITLNFSRLIPDTLVSSDLEIIEDFIADHDRAILKPLCNKHEGLGVLVMQQGNKNLRSVVELLTNFEERPIMVQEFIGDAKDGDKRVIMVNGKIIDFIKRVPPEDDYRASPTSGGSFIETDLTEHDKFICNSLSDFLLSNGIHLAGIDIIEGKLMQINITSPTSLPDIDRLRNLDGEHKIERKVLIELLNYSEKYKK